MTMTHHLDDIYAATAFGTTLIGLVGLAMGVRTEVVEPIVLVGALVVGYVNIYWLAGGEGAY